MTTAGVLTVLRTLVPTTDGSLPKGSLVQASDGNFYGVTSTGGTYKAGTIFKLTSTGTFSVMRHLNLVTDGGTPLGGLIIAPKNGLVATPIKNVAVTEDVAKAITLIGNELVNRRNSRSQPLLKMALFRAQALPGLTNPKPISTGWIHSTIP